MQQQLHKAKGKKAPEHRTRNKLSAKHQVEENVPGNANLAFHE
jgi:hypothetical protein